MVTIENLTVNVTYTVSLGKVEMPKNVHTELI
jgi:hypothetical protein